MMDDFFDNFTPARNTYHLAQEQSVPYTPTEPLYQPPVEQPI